MNSLCKEAKGGVVFRQTIFSCIGGPVKTTRIWLLLLAVFLCLSIRGFAQSNAHPDYSHQHKDAEKYQKSIKKQRRKQAKEPAKAAKANRDRHR
jgi:hypothetical protein